MKMLYIISIMLFAISIVLGASMIVHGNDFIAALSVIAMMLGFTATGIHSAFLELFEKIGGPPEPK